MLNRTSKANGGPLRMLSVQEAAGELGISRSLTYELLSSGALRSVKIRRRRLVPREAIEAFIARLPAAVLPIILQKPVVLPDVAGFHDALPALRPVAKPGTPTLCSEGTSGELEI